MLSLQFGELSAFRGVVGKLIVGKDCPWNNLRSHIKPSTVGCARRSASQPEFRFSTGAVAPTLSRVLLGAHACRGAFFLPRAQSLHPIAGLDRGLLVLA